MRKLLGLLLLFPYVVAVTTHPPTCSQWGKVDETTARCASQKPAPETMALDLGNGGSFNCTREQEDSCDWLAVFAKLMNDGHGVLSSSNTQSGSH